MTIKKNYVYQSVIWVPQKVEHQQHNHFKHWGERLGVASSLHVSVRNASERMELIGLPVNLKKDRFTFRRPDLYAQ